MNILTISTTNATYLGFYHDTSEVTAYFEKNSSNISENIDKIYKKIVKKEKPELIIVDLGPGSFTGSRIGVAFAKGLALAFNIPIVGISILSAVCYQKFLADGEIAGIYSAKIDANNGNVYHLNLNLPFEILTASQKPVGFKKSSEYDIINESVFRSMTLLGIENHAAGNLSDVLTIAPIYGRPVNITPPKK